MSRTFRRDHYADNCGANFGKKHHVHGDKKKWYKPGKDFKKIAKDKRKAAERAAVNKAVSDENAVIPKFPKSDQWNYL